MAVVAGSDLTARLLSQALPEGTRIALIGGSTAQRDWLSAARPEAEHFHHQPPMGLRTDADAQAAVAAFIEAVQPHLALLTVGAVAAFIVRSDGALTAEAVDQYCRTCNNLVAFKRPRRIAFLDALPVNPSGKVLKRELVARFGAVEAA